MTENVKKLTFCSTQNIDARVPNTQLRFLPPPPPPNVISQVTLMTSITNE